MKLVLVGFHITVAEEEVTIFNIRPHIPAGSMVKIFEINKEKINP